MGPGESQQESAAPSEMGDVLLNAETVGRLLEVVAELADRTLPSADAVSLTLPAEDGPFTPNATDPLAQELDEVQYAAQKGPCLEALEVARPVSATLADARERWPVFTDAALAHGVVGILSVPLLAGHLSVGALNMYSRSSGTFADSEAVTATLLAEQAATAVACTLAYSDLSARADQLQQALTTRDLIGQAKGILMKAEGCDANAAFDLLRRASQRTNRKLRDVAGDLVASVTRQ